MPLGEAKGTPGPTTPMVGLSDLEEPVGTAEVELAATVDAELIARPVETGNITSPSPKSAEIGLPGCQMLVSFWEELEQTVISLGRPCRARGPDLTT
mmetsp:Transcript_54829/g.117073  ORF Transcript_54829/g.117073 Transcript_54829/m.117073 type:complete len:97 (-) Transcript_54829:1526-1816(-)